VPVTVTPLDPVLNHVNSDHYICGSQTFLKLSYTLRPTLMLSAKNSAALLPCMLSAPPISCYFSLHPDNTRYTVQIVKLGVQFSPCGCYFRSIKSNVDPVNAIKACRGSRGIALLVLNLGTRWRLVSIGSFLIFFSGLRSQTPSIHKAPPRRAKHRVSRSHKRR
jgi:hypothetical protein